MRRRRASRDLIHLPLALDATPPDPAAANAIDGFDALPREFRDLLNYHTAPMVSGDRPIASILPLIVSHGPTRVLDALRSTLDKVAANPSRFQDVRENNTTQRDMRPTTLQKLRQRR